MGTNRTKSRGLGALVAPVCLSLVGLVAATGTILSVGSASAADDERPAKLELVMDSSGSMKEPAEGGTTKIAAAKSALGAVIDNLPEDQEVGLRVYGATVFSKADAGACTDSQLEVPISTDNRDQMRQAVDSYEPYGETPIGYALEGAGEDLGQSGPRTIVLVSDGEPTCAPDPCEVAKKLSAQGIDLHIDVVGLAVNSAARSALQCIANAGNGTYYDADDEQGLTDAMVSIQERSAEPYRAEGQPVTGSSDPSSAPTLTAGDWLDATAGGKGDRYYRIARSLQGSTLVASATYEGKQTAIIQAYLSADSMPCGASGRLAIGGNLTTAAASSAATDNAQCAAADELILKVTGDTSLSRLPLEITVTEYGAVTNESSLPATVDGRWAAPRAAGTRTQVTGGTSFADAEALAPGRYSGEIVPGEIRTFSVPAEWGQQPTAMVTFAPLSASTGSAPAGGLQWYAPSRTVSGDPTIGTAARVLPSGLVPQTGVTFGLTTPPINFRLLQEPRNDGVAGESGDYTLTIGIKAVGSGKTIPIPYDLRLAVNGQPVAGPEFDDTTVAGAETAESATTSASPSDTPTATPSEASATPSDSGDTDGPSPILWGVGGAALLVILVAAGVLFTRWARRT